MHLADGRRLLSPALVAAERDRDSGVLPRHVIEIHPNFKVIALANRPGYPFLGNDFFGECGDVFSCHVVDNPDRASQLQMLKGFVYVGENDCGVMSTPPYGDATAVSLINFHLSRRASIFSCTSCFPIVRTCAPSRKYTEMHTQTFTHAQIRTQRL